jgi:Concanavalin A-like lectin/glucanases superfamily
VDASTIYSRFLRPRAVICIVLLLGAAGGIVAMEAWHGPIVLSLSAGHGIDAGDLLAVPLVALALAVARAQAGERFPWSWPAPASAITLGALLLLAGVVAKAGGGPLVPSGGGTLDGSIRLTSGTTPLPVDRWSDVAVTYDGATLRLYVNGRQVSSQATTGTIQTPSNPLWIGGNRPYGENFRGLIDEIRVYDHALSENEIRRDMGRPVGPAGGFVAAYAFDAGSGATAADASGNHNTGEIRGATWAPGRYGDALSFDGETAVVRVPASRSLNLTKAMTLSAWIRPSAPQSGWRTIVQRQTDAYILAASSGRQNRFGRIDDVRAGLVAAAAAWFCLVIATMRSPWTAARRRSWWLPVALFTVGSLGDVALAPSGTLIGPALVALWLAATAPGLVERVSFLVAAAVCIGLTIGSLADLAGLEAALSRSDGATARTVAIGGLFALAGLMQLAAATRAGRRPDVAAPQRVPQGP